MWQAKQATRLMLIPGAVPSIGAPDETASGPADNEERLTVRSKRTLLRNAVSAAAR